jgi:hypothetical protein
MRDLSANIIVNNLPRRFVSEQRSVFFVQCHSGPGRRELLILRPVECGLGAGKIHARISMIDLAAFHEPKKNRPMLFGQTSWYEAQE